MTKVPVTVIVLTYNEEANIQSCLESVKEWTDEIFIVDSFSNDNTLEIAGRYTERIYQNAWVHWAHQRNWALDNLPIVHDWVLFLDADERLTKQLKEEIAYTLVDPNTAVVGYYIKRNFYFLGRWLKHGGYQADYILRLIRKEKARSVGRGAREYVTVQGKLGQLREEMIHEDKKDLNFWINKHNRLASLEALELLQLECTKGLTEEFSSNNVKKIEHSFKIWLREKLWIKMPIFIRSFFYFFYRYVVQFGFLDGKQGFIYSFLHALWFPLLIDAKYLELKLRHKNNH